MLERRAILYLWYYIIMEKANVLVVEGHSNIRSLLRKLLDSGGHTVVEADSKEQVTEIINSSVAAGEKLDIALVDGNLSEGSWDCADGTDVVRLLREYRKKLGLTMIIGTSAMPMTLFLGADEYIDKGNLGKELLGYIKRLPELRPARIETA